MQPVIAVGPNDMAIPSPLKDVAYANEIAKRFARNDGTKGVRNDGTKGVRDDRAEAVPHNDSLNASGYVHSMRWITWCVSGFRCGDLVRSARA